MAVLTHVADTSALLALYAQETGSDRLGALLRDEQNSVALSALSILEFWSALKRKGADQSFEEEWDVVLPAFAAVLPVTEDIAHEAIALRRAASARVPTVDTLIAATAVVHGAVLIHRDPHFQSIPANRLRQEFIG